MRDVQQQITGIEQKLEKLFVFHNQLIQENSVLEEENRLLKEEVRQNRRQIVEMQNSMSLLKRAKGGSISGDQQKDLDKMLDTYIREIDKCIATLGSRQ